VIADQIDLMILLQSRFNYVAKVRDTVHTEFIDQIAFNIATKILCIYNLPHLQLSNATTALECCRRR